MLRPAAVWFALLLAPAAQAFGHGCAGVAPEAAFACEQSRADRALDALSHRYRTLWAGLSPHARAGFSAAERRWLNGGRWDQHAGCVAAASAGAPADVVASRCLADVTLAHLASLPVVAGARLAGQP